MLKTTSQKSHKTKTVLAISKVRATQKEPKDLENSDQKKESFLQSRRAQSQQETKRALVPTLDEPFLFDKNSFQQRLIVTCELYFYYPFQARFHL